MTEKRFTLNIDSEWWVVGDNTIKVNEFGYRDDLDIEDMGRGLRKELTEQETVNLLNQLYEENRELQRHLDVMRSGALTDDKRIKELYDENEQLKEEKKALYEEIDFLRVFIKKQGFKVKLDSDAE